MIESPKYDYKNPTQDTNRYESWCNGGILIGYLAKITIVWMIELNNCNLNLKPRTLYDVINRTRLHKTLISVNITLDVIM